MYVTLYFGEYIHINIIYIYIYIYIYISDGIHYTMYTKGYWVYVVYYNTCNMQHCNTPYTTYTTVC